MGFRVLYGLVLAHDLQQNSVKIYIGNAADGHQGYVLSDLAVSGDCMNLSSSYICTDRRYQKIAQQGI